MKIKSKMTTVLLAWTLGGFGAHKFYLGRTGAGVVSLLFFWTFIPAFIAIIESVVYLFMSDREWDRYTNAE